MSRIPARVASALAVAALGLSLAACQADDGASPEASASSSASSSVHPSMSPKPKPADRKAAAIEQRAADAEKRYREFREIAERYAKKGKDPFWELMNNGYLGSPELQESQQSFWSQFVDLKLKEVGKIRIASIELTGYDGNPLAKDFSGHRVLFKVCADSSDWDTVRPDGTSAVKPGPSRVVMNVVMRGQPGGPSGGHWSVNTSESTGKEC